MTKERKLEIIDQIFYSFLIEFSNKKKRKEG